MPQSKQASDPTTSTPTLIPLFSCPLRDVGDHDPEGDLRDDEIDTHCGTSVNHFRWDEPEYLPEFKAWAVATFGESIRDHELFAVYGS